jgi:hypothetical protein
VERGNREGGSENCFGEIYFNSTLISEGKISSVDRALGCF